MALAFDPSIQQQEEIEGSQEASLGTVTSIIESVKTDVKVDVKVEQIYSDDALREILGTEYEKFLELIKHLPPELQRDALYSLKAYLDGQKHTFESLKNSLSYSVYSIIVDEVTQTKETLIGTIYKKRQPGEDEYFYRGKKIGDEGFLVAIFGNVKVIIPLEGDLGKQYRELKEDGYEHIYWVHKDGDRVKIEELGETGDIYRGNYAQTYQYVQDNNGTHVLSFQYRPDNEGNILTYYKIDNNGWKLLEDPKELQGLKDELGRDMSEVVKEKEPGFFVPENEFLSMYLYTPQGREQLLGGSEPAPPTFNEKLELVKQEISQYMEQYGTQIETLKETQVSKELSPEEFSRILYEAYLSAISPKEIYKDPYVLPMDEETAIHSLEKLGLNGEQIKQVIELSFGNPYTLARMVDKIEDLIQKSENAEEPPMGLGPLLGTKEAFQLYLEYKQLLGGGEEMPKNEIAEQSSNEILAQESQDLDLTIKTDEATANVPKEIPEEIKKEAQYYAEAIAMMDWTLDKEDFANFVAQKLLKERNA